MIIIEDKTKEAIVYIPKTGKAQEPKQSKMTITENGLYDVVGRYNINVDVEVGNNTEGLLKEIDQLENEVTQLTNDVAEKQTFIDTATGITITENGTYKPEEGVVGYNEVIVNVVCSCCGVTGLPVVDNTNNYFYIQSAEDNNTIYFYSSNIRARYDITLHLSKLEYSYDGIIWTSLKGVKSLPLERYGDYIFIRNVSTTNITPTKRSRTISSLFGSEYPVKVGGNVQKFLSNYANPTSVNYNYLFANHRAMVKYKYDNIAYFDIEIPNGTNFSYMFDRNEGLTELPTIERLSISGTGTATNFNGMFRNCPSLTEVLLFDTSNGTNFSYMFNGCTSLTEVPQLNTSNGTDFDHMFAFCSLLTENGIPQLDTSNGTNFSSMFRNSTSLTTIPQLNTSNGTNFSYMFLNCSNLTKVPQFDVSNGTNFTQMFKGCTLLTDVRFIGSINSSIDFSESKLLTYDSVKSILTACAATTNTDAKTISFANIFLIKEIIGEDVDTLLANCLSKGWTISGLALIEEPAIEESEYFYIKALNPLKQTKVTISNDTLLYEQKPYYEFSLDAINWFDLEPLKVSEFALDENDKLYLRVKQNIENNNTLPIVVISDYVLIGGKVISLLSNDNTISNMEDLFYSSKLRLVYSHCDLSYSNNLMKTFANLRDNDGLTAVNLNNSDTSNCTNFSGMFYRRKYLKQIIGNLDTSNGTDFSYMFDSCELLVTAPQLDTSKGTDFSYMFGYCHSLTTIPQLDVSNATKIFGMFGSCYNLTNITFVGSINASINFSTYTKLTYDSIKSILTACAATTKTNAKTLSFNITLTDNNGELATLVSSCTSKGWTVSGLTLN